MANSLFSSPEQQCNNTDCAGLRAFGNKRAYTQEINLANGHTIVAQNIVGSADMEKHVWQYPQV